MQFLLPSLFKSAKAGGLGLGGVIIIGLITMLLGGDPSKGDTFSPDYNQL